MGQFVASLIRVKGWTVPGMRLAFGNRDNLPEATPLAGRAGRTAPNTPEKFILFAAAFALSAHVAGAAEPQVLLGAKMFFWARLLYIPIYYAGIIYMRIATWLLSIAGMAMRFCRC